MIHLSRINIFTVTASLRHIVTIIGEFGLFPYRKSVSMNTINKQKNKK